MIKQTITYENFDGDSVTDDLYFNLSKSELADHMYLADQLQELQDIYSLASKEERSLTPDEVKKILNLIKLFIKLSYGERSEDGKRFRKNPEIWLDFQDSAAYDAFLMSLFIDPANAVKFMINILPRDLVAQAQEKLAGENPELAAEVKAITSDVEIPVQRPPTSDRQTKKPTVKDLAQMTPDEFMEWKSKQ